MLLSLPKARLITFSKTRLIKFYLKMTDPIHDVSVFLGIDNANFGDIE